MKHTLQLILFLFTFVFLSIIILCVLTLFLLGLFYFYRVFLFIIYIINKKSYIKASKDSVKYNNLKGFSQFYFSKIIYSNIIKIIFISINIKIILFSLFIFNVHYLTPLVISIVYYINLHIYYNIRNINYPIEIITKKIIFVFVISSFVCITKYYINLLSVNLVEISYILDVLLCFMFIKDSIGYYNSNISNNIDNYNLFSNKSDTNKPDNNSIEENTSSKSELTSENSDSDSDKTPTRGRSTRNSGSIPRSISPRSIWKFIDDSYNESTQNIKKFFGNTFYIWDKAYEPQKISRFPGAIEETNSDNTNDSDDSYQDSNGNKWKNPNGTTYTNQDELRSIINIKKLARTPSEKANLDKVIDSTGGPIMFTQDTEGNFVFYRLGK